MIISHTHGKLQRIRITLSPDEVELACIEYIRRMNQGHSDPPTTTDIYEDSDDMEIVAEVMWSFVEMEDTE